MKFECCGERVILVGVELEAPLRLLSGQLTGLVYSLEDDLLSLFERIDLSVRLIGLDLALRRPLRGVVILELVLGSLFLTTGALDGRDIAPVLVCAAKISGAIRAISGNELGADICLVDKSIDSAVGLRSDSGRRRRRSLRIDARNHELAGESPTGLLI